MIDRLSDCANCTCPRLDELEEKVGLLLEYYEKYGYIQDRILLNARRLAAKEDVEWITRRGMTKRYGVNLVSARKWTMEPDFPPKIIEGKGPHPDRWILSQVDEWYAHHIKKPNVRAQLAKKNVVFEEERE